ncbi:MAG: glutaredoxin [Propionicimonas sp.]
MIEPREPGPRTMTRITLVTSPGCHFCADAHRVLTTLAEAGMIELGTLDAESPDGERLVSAHRPALFPLVLLDGHFFSAGRLPRRKLAHTLGVDRAAV